MTVSQLIEILNKLEPDYEVMLYDDKCSIRYEINEVGISEHNIDIIIGEEEGSVSGTPPDGFGTLFCENCKVYIEKWRKGGLNIG